MLGNRKGTVAEDLRHVNIQACCQTHIAESNWSTWAAMFPATLSNFVDTTAFDLLLGCNVSNAASQPRVPIDTLFEAMQQTLVLSM